MAFEKILSRNSGDDLYFWFKALSNIASTIAFHQLEELLDIMLSFSWAPNSRSAEVIACYSDALVQAVAGSKNITFRVFKSLTKQFRCRKKSVGDVDWSSTEEIVRSVHHCVKRVVSVVPSSTHVLFQALEASYPTKYDECMDQVVYLEAALQISVYCEETARGMLDTIIQKLLALDIDIVSVDDMVAEDTIFSFEENVEKEKHAAERLKAQNMDDLMERIFVYIDNKKLDRIPKERLESPFVTLQR